MKNILIIIAVAVALPFTCLARIIPYQPYEKLFKQADVVAIVELKSVSPSEKKLTGHGSPDKFDGKVALLTVGIVLKGDSGINQISLLHFSYSKMGEPNGALFLDFSDSEKHQYLVFLKKDDDVSLAPVTGHYDAALSVKKIVKDHFSPIETKK